MARIVVLDACVLYPAPLRDLLVRLALPGSGLMRARWSEQIHDEWIRNLAADRPDLSRENLERTRQLMDKHVSNSLVTGFEPLIPQLTLPDVDDRHVLAAAIHAKASAIITFNLTDFPDPLLLPHGVEAIHPDDFAVQLFAKDPASVIDTVRSQRAALKKPNPSVDEFLERLEICQLPKFVALLRQFASEL